MIRIYTLIHYRHFNTRTSRNLPSRNDIDIYVRISEIIQSPLLTEHWVEIIGRIWGKVEHKRRIDVIEQAGFVKVITRLYGTAEVRTENRQNKPTRSVRNLLPNLNSQLRSHLVEHTNVTTLFEFEVENIRRTDRFRALTTLEIRHRSFDLFAGFQRKCRHGRLRRLCQFAVRGYDIHIFIVAGQWDLFALIPIVIRRGGNSGTSCEIGCRRVGKLLNKVLAGNNNERKKKQKIKFFRYQFLVILSSTSLFTGNLSTTTATYQIDSNVAKLLCISMVIA